MSELSIKFLKSEYCRFEPDYRDLKVRIKIVDIYDILQSNEFTAKIISSLGMEYDLTDWTEVITDTTTKLIKEYDLNLVTFPIENSDIDLPLNIGTHTLQVSINGVTTSSEFKVVPVTVATVKSQYLLGVDLESRIELGFKLPLRKITGVEILEISKETPVGEKELVWNATNSTLQWDNGVPVTITDDYTDYLLLNYMSGPGIVDGDLLKVRIEDIDELPAESVVENVVVDVINYEIEDFQYWINNGYRIVSEIMIMTGLEPTLYSSDKSLGYKYLDPVYMIPKPFSESSNLSFEFPVNQLQSIIELWGHYKGVSSPTKINVDLNRVEFTIDGRVVVSGYPYDIGFSGNVATLGIAGTWDRTVYSKNQHGARNKVINFWNGTVIAGIVDEDLRSLALETAARISAIDLLLAAGLGKGAGVSSRSFSVGGISSSYQTTESAENSLFSSYITTHQQILGTGRSSKDQQNAGLINLLKTKIEGGSMIFKY